MDALQLELDAASPVPLYRQLAEALRYRIARGALAPGARLPALREASARWGVHLHTVRRGYHELQRAGLVTVRRPGGTSVALDAADAAQGESGRFAREVLEEGRRRFGLDAPAISALIAAAARPAAVAEVHVVECSQELSGALARQISGSLGVPARPCLLEALDASVQGHVVATWFHYNEVRARLPNRTDDLHFVAIEPLLRQARTIVRQALKGDGLVTLAERDAQLAPAIATDVRRLLNSDRVRVKADARSHPATLLRQARGPVVCSPGSWELLSDAERELTGAFPLEYRLSDASLVQLRETLGVSPAA